MIILNSRKVMGDLLDARSTIYSDRPHLVMANEMSVYAMGVRTMAYYFRIVSDGKDQLS